MELPKLKDFLDAFSVAWPISLGVAASCGLLVFLHDAGVRYLQILPDWILAIAFVLALFAGVVFCIHVLRAIGAFAATIIGRYKRSLKIRNLLVTLSDNEREVLSYLVMRTQQSLVTEMGGADVSTLVQKRLLLPANGVHSILEWPHKVPDDVWLELMMDAENFQTADPEGPPPYRRRRW